MLLFYSVWFASTHSMFSITMQQLRPASTWWVCMFISLLKKNIFLPHTQLPGILLWGLVICFWDYWEANKFFCIKAFTFVAPVRAHQVTSFLSILYYVVMVAYLKLALFFLRPLVTVSMFLLWPCTYLHSALTISAFYNHLSVAINIYFLALSAALCSPLINNQLCHFT